MGFSYKNNVFNSKTAKLLAAINYQTYSFFLEGKLVLPSGFKLRSTIRGFANVEDPTELLFGFIAESQEEIIIAFRGYAAYPADLLSSYDIFQIRYPFVRNGGKTSRAFLFLKYAAR